jgi:hypothetical protein
MPDLRGGSAREIHRFAPYQISRAYFTDARMEAGEYEDCRREDYGRAVVVRYMLRYRESAYWNANAEILARTHNGGPNGSLKKCTLPYWDRVRKELEKCTPSPAPPASNK